MVECSCRDQRSYAIGISRKVYFSKLYRSFSFASYDDFPNKVYSICSNFKFLIALNNLCLKEVIKDIDLDIGMQVYEIYFSMPYIPLACRRRLDIYNLYRFNHYSLNYNSLCCDSCQQNTYYIDSRLVNLDEQTKQDIINEYYIRNL